MPEYAEVRISSDFINEKSYNKKFVGLYSIRNSNSELTLLNQNFRLSSDSYGKQLFLYLEGPKSMTIHVFMSLMGNWSSIKTSDWESIRFARLRFDDDSGNSLVLHGGYMGPKFSIDKPFSGTKRGPDPLKDFSNFRDNIINNLADTKFNKPLAEVILNQKYFNGVGAYLAAEIIGRSDLNPFATFNSLSVSQTEMLINLINRCCKESYELGGGELISWNNPLTESNIDSWIMFYNNKERCIKHNFGNRNIWIDKKWIIK